MRFRLEALKRIFGTRHDAAIDRCFHTRPLTLDGSDFRFRVFTPPGPPESGAWPVILALHGAGGYGEDGSRHLSEGLAPAIYRHPERFPALVVFPQCPVPQSIGNQRPGWQGIGGRIALAALDKAIEEFAGDKSRIALTGLSVGGNGAWHLAYHQPQRFTRLLVVCGFVAERMGSMYPVLYPSLVPEAADPAACVARRLARLPTWIVHGAADPTVPVEHSRGMETALRAVGAPVQYTEISKGGHNVWDATYERADVASWLLAPPLEAS